MKPVIYADVLFVVNLLINYILLWTTSLLSRVRSAPLRLLCGAVTGAVYAVLIFFPQIRMFYTVAAKFAASLVIVAASFRIRRWQTFARVLGIFYFVSFTFGGVTLALLYYTGAGLRMGAVLSNGVFYFDLPWTTLAASTLAAYAVIRFVWRIYRNGRGREFCAVELSAQGRDVRLHALVDTGNMLTDPLTGTPVMVAEFDSVRHLMPDTLRALYLRFGQSSPEQVMALIDDPDWSGRLRIIPFSALGTESGMLLGFKPDRITVGNRSHTDVIVGICATPLSAGREYDALLSPETAGISN